MAKHRGGRATFPGRIPCPVCGGPIPELLSVLPWVQPAGPVPGPRLPGESMSFTLDKSLSKKRENVIDKSDAVDKR